MPILANPVASQTDDIIRSILGRALSSEQVSQAFINADGSLEGVFNGIAFAGTWTLDDNKYCREFTRGLTGAPICMDVFAEYAPDGDIQTVIFVSPGGKATFSVGQ
ncbi:hypothetical protein [Aliiroseovarius sp. F20344]|uniref:hypothetical protein n=1 Tax=Aliiroseovarius sp. F20344 TaxID=2926414 RepID=UPI001FF0E772|nr:hypothetical protein [Aliiroseovarius sp. F20344]MCK0142479.1 hypothetical protein [Aliiroseovarius sp. F20344]